MLHSPSLTAPSASIHRRTHRDKFDSADVVVIVANVTGLSLSKVIRRYAAVAVAISFPFDYDCPPTDICERKINSSIKSHCLSMVWRA